VVHNIKNFSFVNSSYSKTSLKFCDLLEERKREEKEFKEEGRSFDVVAKCRATKK